MPSAIARALAGDPAARHELDSKGKPWFLYDLQGTDVKQRVLDLVPVIGEAMAAKDAWEASGEAGKYMLDGDYQKALPAYGRMAMSLLGAVPLAGGLFRKMSPRHTASMFGAGGRTLKGDFDIEIYPGQSVPVLQNPSPEHLDGFIRRTRHKAVRVIDDPNTGDRYVWPADASALHGQVAKELGIPFDPSGPDAGKIMTID